MTEAHGVAFVDAMKVWARADYRRCCPQGMPRAADPKPPPAELSAMAARICRGIEHRRHRFGTVPARWARLAAGRQVELGALEGLLDRRDTGRVALPALLDALLGSEILEGCSPLLESWPRYWSYLATSAVQYAASLDWANDAAGNANATATTGSRPLIKAFIAILLCRLIGNEDLGPNRVFCLTTD